MLNLHPSVRHGAERGAADLAGVLGQHAAGLFRPGPLPCRPALLPLRGRHVHVQPARFRVNPDPVAVFHPGDRSADGRLGRGVPPRIQAAPENRPSVISATSFPSPRPMMADVGDSISCMPGPPRGPSLRMTTTWFFFTRPFRIAASADSRTRTRWRGLEPDAFADRDLGQWRPRAPVAAQNHQMPRRLDRRRQGTDDRPFAGWPADVPQVFLQGPARHRQQARRPSGLLRSAISSAAPCR